MRKINSILFAIIMMTIVISCEKQPVLQNEILISEKINTKWLVDSILSDYRSFEFNKSGNYIIEQKGTQSNNNKTILYGNYDISDNKTLVLSNFGTIEVTQIDDKSFKFNVILSLDPNNEISLIGSKHSEIKSTPKTDLLCKTWELLTENGVSVKGSEHDIDLLFSASGTYFVYYNQKNSGALAQWQWKDDFQNNLLYSWNINPDWGKSDMVEIRKLSTDSLIIVENDTRYALKPKQAIKSKIKALNNSILTTIFEYNIQSGFLNK